MAQTERLICAINENADVRPFDWLTLTVSIFALAATAGLAIILWRLDRRRARIEGRRTAVSGLMAAIDRQNVHLLVAGNGPDLDFMEAIGGDIRVFEAILDPDDADFVALVRGELDYTRQRLSEIKLPNSADAVALQISQKLHQFKHDISVAFGHWENNNQYRKLVREFRAQHPAYAIWYTEAADIRAQLSKMGN